MIKIDKGIPIPNNVSSKGRPTKYPWEDMEVGDSFLFPSNTISPLTSTFARNILNEKRHQLFMSHPKRYLTRKTSEGYRCWRIK